MLRLFSRALARTLGRGTLCSLGAFAVSVSAQTFEYEPNASFADATLILSGVRVLGQIRDLSDVDTFALDVSYSGALSVVVSGDNASYATLKYFSNAQRELGSFSLEALVDFFDRPLPKTFLLGVPEPGRYYLRLVYSSPPPPGSRSGQYVITATFNRLIPEVSSHPANQTVVAGSSAYFFVSAIGNPPLTYQWRKDGVPISGATASGYYIYSTTAASAGRYSVVVSNQNGSASSSEAILTIQEPSKLINLSTLGYLNPDLSSGFSIRGSSSKRILARAVGPGLVQFGVSGTVADPTLTLYDAKGNLIRANDDWSVSDASVFSSVGAFALSSGSRDAAILATLEPGNYVVSAAGLRGTQGVVLLEVYEVP